VSGGPRPCSVCGVPTVRRQATPDGRRLPRCLPCKIAAISCSALHRTTAPAVDADEVERLWARVDLVARGVIKGCIESGRDPAQTIAAFRIPGAWEEEGFRLLRHYGVQYFDRTVSIDEAARRAIAGTTQER